MISFFSLSLSLCMSEGMYVPGMSACAMCIAFHAPSSIDWVARRVKLNRISAGVVPPRKK